MNKFDIFSDYKNRSLEELKEDSVRWYEEEFMKEFDSFEEFKEYVENKLEQASKDVANGDYIPAEEYFRQLKDFEVNYRIRQ